jgi:hypothetical protein
MEPRPRAGTREGSPSERAREISRQLAGESKLASLSSDFWVFAVVALVILIAGILSGNEYGSLNANEVWLYITILASAYLLSRGLAKLGTERGQTGEEASRAPRRRGRSSERNRTRVQSESGSGDRDHMPEAVLESREPT